MSGQTSTTSRQANKETSTTSEQTSTTGGKMSTKSAARVFRVTQQVIT